MCFSVLLNKNEINRYTQIKNKTQNYKTCYDYLIKRMQNKELYYSINTSKGEFIGTLTMREINKNFAYENHYNKLYAQDKIQSVFFVKFPKSEKLKIKKFLEPKNVFNLIQIYSNFYKEKMLIWHFYWGFA